MLINIIYNRVQIIKKCNKKVIHLQEKHTKKEPSAKTALKIKKDWFNLQS